MSWAFDCEAWYPLEARKLRRVMVCCFERSSEGLHSKRASTYWSRVLGLRGQTEGQVPGQGLAEVMRAISKPLRQDRPRELSGLSGVRISPGEGKQETDSWGGLGWKRMQL